MAGCGGGEHGEGIAGFISAEFDLARLATEIANLVRRRA
jgi:hypothetical protein